jgi:hypothetical protein
LSRVILEHYKMSIHRWMFMFTKWCTYLVLENTKIYLKFTLKCSYMFRSLQPSSGSSYLGLAKVTIVQIFGKTHHCILCSGVAAC